MKIQYAPVLLLAVAICLLLYAWRLRCYKAVDHLQEPDAHLSVQERQKKVDAGAWVCFAAGVVAIAGAGIVFWLENAR